jgi:hypothetical protein
MNIEYAISINECRSGVTFSKTPVDDSSFNIRYSTFPLTHKLIPNAR